MAELPEDIPRYRGRFAPSPTGPLHFGSLVAATASYLDARSRNGEWVVRMEDVDRTRTVPGAAEAILQTLRAFGFVWTEPVLYQSTRDQAYRDALETLNGMAYPCACSRRESAGCRCRNGLPPGRHARSWRMRAGGQTISFVDRIQGPFTAPVDDAVLLRADGLYAYQLAVVVDDAFQGITDVVRGADLLDSTPRQIWLQRALGLPQPRYAHVPVAAGPDGAKLSKQTLAPAIDPAGAESTLARALDFLGHTPPAGLPLGELWEWAVRHWDSERVPKIALAPTPPTSQPR